MSKKKSNQFEVKVQVVPADGGSRTLSTMVAASGASLREVLEALGIDVKNKNFTVNGRPADLNRHVTKDDIVEAKDRAPVQVAERPASS